LNVWKYSEELDDIGEGTRQIARQCCNLDGELHGTEVMCPEEGLVAGSYVNA
jgi:hypothetical protein